MKQFLIFALFALQCLSYAHAKTSNDLNPKKAHVNGNLVEYSVLNGMIHGIYLATYPNGNKKAEGRFEYNQRVGLWKFYDQEGNLSVQREYTNNFCFNSKANKVSIKELVRDKDSVPYPFEKIEENHIKYAKRIWMDSVIISEANELILDAVSRGLVKLYDSSDDQFRAELSNQVATSNLTVDHFKFKMDYFYDSVCALGEIRIIGITPVVKNEHGNTRELCLLYYPELRPVLAKGLIESDIYPEYIKNVDDIFFFGMYTGRMIKESNAYNKPLDEPLSAEATRLLLVETDNDLIINQNTSE